MACRNEGQGLSRFHAILQRQRGRCIGAAVTCDGRLAAQAAAAAAASLGPGRPAAVFLLVLTINHHTLLLLLLLLLRRDGFYLPALSTAALHPPPLARLTLKCADVRRGWGFTAIARTLLAGTPPPQLRELLLCVARQPTVPRGTGLRVAAAA
jgi:hypothetical protein